MTVSALSWQDMFLQQRQAELGWYARKYGCDMVCSLADEEVMLTGMASEMARSSDRKLATERVAPSLVAITPVQEDESLAQFKARVQKVREDEPQAEVAGFGPSKLSKQEVFSCLDRGVFLGGRLGNIFSPSSSIDELIGAGSALTAVLIYNPEVEPEAIEEAVAYICKLPELCSVVALPAAAGDRIPLPGLTTAGSVDMMMISSLRILLEPRIRVRASWAALGWKVAQLALAYGADQIAGLSAAEALAYGSGGRAVSRVERRELDRGLAEARCQDIGWKKGERL